MRRAAQPPRPPRPVVRGENAPGAARQNENVALAGDFVFPGCVIKLCFGLPYLFLHLAI